MNFQTRAENTVREQKIRIDNMTNEHNRINFENERNQESKEELNRQNTRYDLVYAFFVILDWFVQSSRKNESIEGRVSGKSC